MKLYLLIIFSLIFQSSYSSQPYWELVNNAEDYIYKKDYKNALNIYELIFQEYKNVTYCEYHNAAVCYLKLGEFSETTKMFEELVFKGYELKDFDREVFNPIKGSKYWQAFKENKYPKLRKRYLEGVNYNYRSSLQNIIKNDQIAARSKNMVFQDSVFYWQVDSLIKFIDKNGFPNCFINKDSLMIRVYAAFRHYFGLMHRCSYMNYASAIYQNMDFEKNNLEKLLIENINKGMLHPKYIADAYSYSDMGNKYGAIHLWVYLEEERLELRKLSENEIKRANESRKKIGLNNITNEQLEFLLLYRKNGFPFKEIKNAYLNCDSCKINNEYSHVFGEIIGLYEPEVSFILHSLPKIDAYMLMDVDKYKK